jgi:tetraacyldisaccharide-1-P 4'-kinase
VFIVTRCESQVQFRAIKRRLACWNPQAPVFEARLHIRGWRDIHTNEAVELEPGTKVAAFCGLGNPRAFWRTLDSLHLEVVSCFPFPDHHPYKPAELRLLQHDARRLGAAVLVTTQKDRANLPVDSAAALDGTRTLWLEIEMSVQDEDSFFAVVGSVFS